MEWISVKAYLPDNYAQVLVYSDDSVAACQYLNGEFIIPQCGACDSGWSPCRVDDVTHWMPLPKRPEEFEED